MQEYSYLDISYRYKITTKDVFFFLVIPTAKIDLKLPTWMIVSTLQVVVVDNSP